jgi:hypothetical protein
MTEPADPDALVLEALARAGSDLGKPHWPEFVFDAAHEAGARKVARALEALGYRVTIRAPDEENDGYEVSGSTQLVLELETLQALTRRFEALARECGVDYDGWGADVVG